MNKKGYTIPEGSKVFSMDGKEIGATIDSQVLKSVSEEEGLTRAGQMTPKAVWIIYRTLCGEFGQNFEDVLKRAVWPGQDAEKNRPVLVHLQKQLPKMELTLWRQGMLDKGIVNGEAMKLQPCTVVLYPERPMMWVIEENTRGPMEDEEADKFGLVHGSLHLASFIVPCIVSSDTYRDQPAIQHVFCFQDISRDNFRFLPSLRIDPPQLYGETIRESYLNLFSAMDFLRQPYTERGRERIVPDSKAERQKMKKWEYQPEVVSVSLRAKEYEAHIKSSEAEATGRHLSCRFDVDGHYRNQPCGPKHSQIKRIWVKSYEKGPEDAPKKDRLPRVNIANR